MQIQDVATQAQPAGSPRGAFSRAYAVTLPTLRDETTILSGEGRLTDPGTGLVDGAKFFTCLPVAGRIASPVDAWYGYVAGHDSRAIWLVTAPAPDGPWTWRQPVRTLATTSLFLQTGSAAHVSSPDAVWWGGRIHLYYHGHARSGPTRQETGVATSADGINFSDRQIAMRSTSGEVGSYPHGTSTSYARVVDAGGYLVATFNANPVHTSDGVGTVPVFSGWAHSRDGLDFRVPLRPLWAPSPALGARGNGVLTRVPGGWGIVGGYTGLGLALWFSEELRPGTFRLVGVIADLPSVDGPFIVWDGTTCHFYYGRADGTIRRGVLDWGQA